MMGKSGKVLDFWWKRTTKKGVEGSFINFTVIQLEAIPCYALYASWPLTNPKEPFETLTFMNKQSHVGA